MNVLLLYLLLLKAVVTSFSGLASLPILRQDLVVRHKVLTDRQLNTAVAVGRAGPGPIGLYVVSVGYFVAGAPGACAGMLATITPAFLIIPMIRRLGVRANRPRARSAIQAVTLAAAGLLIASTAPLAKDAVTGPLPMLIAVASFLLLAFTRLDNAWVILGSAIAGLASRLIAS
jgi:chromate transporter